MKHKFDLKAASLCALLAAAPALPQADSAKKSDSLLGLNDYSAISNQEKGILPINLNLYKGPLKNEDYEQAFNLLHNIPYAMSIFDKFLMYREIYKKIPVGGYVRMEDQRKIHELKIEFTINL
jgi:hypothetical protein